jgi:hypothetical protein
MSARTTAEYRWRSTASFSSSAAGAGAQTEPPGGNSKTPRPSAWMRAPAVPLGVERIRRTARFGRDRFNPAQDSPPSMDRQTP